MKKRVIGILVATLLLAAGCSAAPAETPAAAEPSAQPTTLTSLPEEEEPITEPTVEATPEPTPEPTPDTFASTLPQLNLDGNFMEPGSLDGIDPWNDKVVAITFDDGPHPDNTPALLDILKDNDVHATFFMVGNLAEKFPDIVKRAYEEGNEIGTHSWDHTSNDLKWSHDEIMDQISRTNDAIEAATGKRALIDRPTEGAINEEVAEAIGREQILWNVDPNDWKPENRDPDIVYNNVVNSGDLRDGSIILSHDIRVTTIEAYDRIIKELKNQGYKFVTVTQMMQIAAIRGKDITYIFNSAPTAKDSAAAADPASTDDGGPEESPGAEESPAA